MTTIMAKMAIIYLVIGLFLTVGGGVDNIITDSVVNESVNGAPQFTQGFKNTFPAVKEDSSSTSPFGVFIDAIKAGGVFVVFIATIFFALPMVLLQAQLPTIILQLIGIPLAVGGVIGIVMFVRSGN